MSNPERTAVLEAVDAGHERARTDLEALCRIPSVAFDGFDPTPVRQSAELVAELLETANLSGVRIIDDGGMPPAVFGERHVSDNAPTVLLYAHHDVQPAGNVTAWTSPPVRTD